MVKPNASKHLTPNIRPSYDLFLAKGYLHTCTQHPTPNTRAKGDRIVYSSSPYYFHPKPKTETDAGPKNHQLTTGYRPSFSPPHRIEPNRNCFLHYACIHPWVSSSLSSSLPGPVVLFYHLRSSLNQPLLISPNHCSYQTIQTKPGTTPANPPIA